MLQPFRESPQRCDGDAMMRALHRLLLDERGQDLAEYGIALAVITIGVITFAMSIGVDVNSLWSHAQPTLESVVSQEQ